MIAAEKWIQDLSSIRPGDRIEVWDELAERCVGTVGEVAPEFGVLWVLEAGTGTRRMFAHEGSRMRLSPLVRAA
ncbi:hypothetical protein ACH9EU_03660 [Kocuria sp. M1R5S2]|uniref:hypothetical protein n=1 Tax=Kocuria rhizosphaerae TaxID=3376285 RepID=UPI0037ADED71